jgi:hypothetical protein
MDSAASDMYVSFNVIKLLLWFFYVPFQTLLYIVPAHPSHLFPVSSAHSLTRLLHVLGSRRRLYDVTLLSLEMRSGTHDQRGFGTWRYSGSVLELLQ